MPEISIVVPIYNVEQYLEECIVSIMNQTLKDIEIICVNDGSTDHSLDILENLQEKDSRIKIISKENSGYGHSVNVGIDVAKGKYLCIVESDDYVDCNMLEEFYRIMEQNNLDMLKSDSRTFIRDNGEDIYTYRKVVPKNELYNAILEQEDYENKFMGYVYTWAGMYRLDFLNRYGIRHHESPGASYQDNGFWFQTSMYAERLMFIDKAFYNLRRDNPNSSFFSKGKVFAMCDEYDFIHGKIAQSQIEEKKRLFQLCFRYRYTNYMWTMNRIDPMYLPDFYLRMRRDFKSALACGEIDADRFNGSEWRYIFSVLRDDEPQKPCPLITIGAMQSINSSTSLYIYGTGLYGKKVYTLLKEAGLVHKLKGFLVTKKENMETLYDLPIIEVNKYDWKEASKIILAMSKSNQKSVMQEMNGAGKVIDMYYSIDNILTEAN